MTVSAASEIADEQVEKMQELENEIESVQSQIADAKEKTKTAMRELETLRVERTKAESEVEELKVEGEEDHRILGLYDW